MKSGLSRFSTTTIALLVLCLFLAAFLAAADQGSSAGILSEFGARIISPVDMERGNTGRSALIWFEILSLATLVSEDLTCIAAGALVAQGRIAYSLGAGACFLGIFAGDLLLFAAGRLLGRPALQRAPLKWFVCATDVERSSRWFSRRGPTVILASRFLPGTRLPTYFAAGLLDAELWKFSSFLLLASAIWTPLLVGSSALLGGEVVRSALLGTLSVVPRLLAAGGVTFCAAKLILSLLSYRGRRLLISSWRRLTHWEFWPPWLLYPPVVGWIALLAFRHRSLGVFADANPAISAGGFVGESKSQILHGLSRSSHFVARFSLIDNSLGLGVRKDKARQFMHEHNLDYPVVLKPDIGQRGAGVVIVKSEAELQTCLAGAHGKTIIQEYVPGCEFGIFYFRYPNEENGHIFSVTEKRFPTVLGDGTATLERLILQDERALLMARFHLKRLGGRALETPRKGETVKLVNLGSHCRGALFLDGGWVITPALEKVIDRISRNYDGFYFGRFDIRAPSVEDLMEGRNFKIVELNGVTSEATHIYDPRYGLLEAYRVLFEQWRIAFEIGAQNRRRGQQPTGLGLILGLLLEQVQQRSGYCGTAL